MKFFKRGCFLSVLYGGDAEQKDRQLEPGNFALFEAGQEIQQEDHSTMNYSSQVLKKPKSLRG